MTDNERSELQDKCWEYVIRETDRINFIATIAAMLDFHSRVHGLTLEEDTEIFTTIEKIRKERYTENGQF